MTDFHEVVVAGGGPVGLVAARAFARVGIPVLVLEPRRTGQSRTGDVRRLVLAERACRLLETFGLWTTVVAGASPVRTVLVRAPRTGRVLRLEAHDHGLEALGWTLGYGDLVARLEAALVHDPRVTVQHGVELVAAHENEDHLVLRLRHDGNEEERPARLLVVAEGVGAGLESLGWPARPSHSARDRAWIIPCQASTLDPATAVEAFLEGGTATLLVPDRGAAVVTLILPDSVGWPEGPAESAEILERLAPRFGLSSRALVPTGEAVSFRVRRGFHPVPVLPRRLIMGSMFHALHPFAAQSLLLAWRDAHAVARRLGERRLRGQDWSGESALRDVVRTRLPEHRLIDAFVHRLPEILALPEPPGLGRLAWRLAGTRHARLLAGYWGMGYGWGRL